MDRDYAQYESRPDDDWFVVWFEVAPYNCNHRDGKPIFRDNVSLYKSKDEALRRYNERTVNGYGWNGPRELSANLTGKELVEIHNRMLLDMEVRRLAPRGQLVKFQNAYLKGELEVSLGDPLPPEAADTPLDVALKVWRQFQFIGDRVTNKWLDGNPESGGGQEKMYRFHIDKLRSPEGIDLIAKQPKQCRIVAEALSAEGRSFMDEDELDLFALNLKRSGKLKTKQSGERIVRYYLPALASLGFAEYKGRRNKGGDTQDEVNG